MGLALIVSDRSGAVVDRRLRAIPGNQNRVIRQTHDAAFLKRQRRWNFYRLTAFLIDDLEYFCELAPLRFLLRPTSQSLGDTVEENNLSFCVRGHHSIANACKCNAQPFRLLPQCLLSDSRVGDVAKAPDAAHISFIDELDA